MTQNERVKAAMSSLLKILEEGDLQTVARAVFRSELNRPSDKWSMMNRLIMFLNGTSDARGYNQWQLMGRQVVKGSKAFYIMAPNTRKIKDEKTEDETDHTMHTMGQGIRCPFAHEITQVHIR